jgi:hypothetical protein
LHRLLHRQAPGGHQGEPHRNRRKTAALIEPMHRLPWMVPPKEVRPSFEATLPLYPGNIDAARGTSLFKDPCQQAIPLGRNACWQAHKSSPDDEDFIASSICHGISRQVATLLNTAAPRRRKDALPRWYRLRRS